MKNKKIFGFIIAGLAAAFLAGCSDINDTKTTAKESGIYTVRGSLSFFGSSGAAPAAFISSKSDARTATASFSEVSDFEWTISAYPYDVDGAVNKDKSYKADFENGSFSVKVPSVGEYLVEARLENDGLLYAEGSTNVIVSESAEENTSATIKASPKASSVLGKVSLPVKLDSASAGKIDNVEVIWRDTNFDVIMNNLGYDWEKRSEDGSEAEDVSDPLFSDFPLAGQDEEVKNNVGAFFDWYKRMTNGELDKTFNFDSTAQTEISYDDIFTGSHSVTINFNDALGNTLYSRREVINVYSGFTTDTWYGSDLADGLSITSENIERYGTEVVKPTSIMLYEYGEIDSGNTEHGYNYYLVEEGNSENIPENSAVVSNFTMYSDSRDFTFFDSNGYFYLLQFTDDYGNSLKSNNPNWPSSNVNFTPLLALGDTTSIGTSDVRTFAIDRQTDILYMLYDRGSVMYLRKYPDLITSNGTNTEYLDITLDIGEFDFGDYCSVSDGKLYFLANNFNILEVVGLTEAKASAEGQTQVSLSSKTIGSIDLNTALGVELESPSAYSGNVTDMLYQDGSVYILVKENSADLSNSSVLTSRGAVIRYNTIFGRTDVCGWTNDSQTVSNTLFEENGDYSYVGMYLSEDSAGENMLYTDATLSSPAILYGSDKILFGDNLEDDAGYIASKFPSICTPAPLENELSSDFFYGPKRFVAIKPKKLVIADDGFAVYTNDDGTLNFKNVNRVVYVDLEDFAISKTESTNAKLGSNIEKMSFELDLNDEVGTAYYAIKGDEERINENTQLYYRDSSTDEVTPVDAKGCLSGKYLCIPCTDAE